MTGTGVGLDTRQSASVSKTEVIRSWGGALFGITLVSWPKLR
jgi:hypothetical protein